MAALVVDGADAAAEAAARRNVVDVMVPPDEIIGRLVRFTESERRAGDKKARASPRSKPPPPPTPSRAGTHPRRERRKKSSSRSFGTAWPTWWDLGAYRAWGALENGLAEYHALLRRRRDALEGANRLAEQNAELRALLNQYLSSKINDELQVPPTAII